MDIERMKDLFGKHMQNFQRELGDLTPEVRRQLHSAIESYMTGCEQKATGLGAAIIQHWEKFMPHVLNLARSQQTKDQLIEACGRMVRQQIDEFQQILGSQFESGSST